MPDSKRTFDMVISAVALVLLAPLFVVVSLWILVDSPGAVFFTQTRIGLRGKPFRIWKFRTMRKVHPSLVVSRASACDPRITRSGRVLRHLKIDELPQLWNVLNGTMSIVGPRPMVPDQVARWTDEERLALTLVPGITDFASIRFHNENELLRGSHDVDAAYDALVRAEKSRLIHRYIRERSMATDIHIIAETARVLVSSRVLKSRRTPVRPQAALVNVELATEEHSSEVAIGSH